jgi:hypothetical protein
MLPPLAQPTPPLAAAGECFQQPPHRPSDHARFDSLTCPVSVVLARPLSAGHSRAPPGAWLTRHAALPARPAGSARKFARPLLEPKLPSSESDEPEQTDVCFFTAISARARFAGTPSPFDCCSGCGIEPRRATSARDRGGQRRIGAAGSRTARAVDPTRQLSGHTPSSELIREALRRYLHAG